MVKHDQHSESNVISSHPPQLALTMGRWMESHGMLLTRAHPDFLSIRHEKRLYEKKQAVELLRKLGNQRQLGYALLHYGHLVGYAQGLFDKAYLVYSEALDIFISLGDLGGMAHTTGNLASLKLELGDCAVAQEFVNDSLKRYSDLNSDWDLSLILGKAAGVALAQDRFEEAVLLAAASSAHRERIGITLPNAFKSRYRQIEENALGTLAEEQRSVLWARGRSMPIAEAVKYALGSKITSS